MSNAIETFKRRNVNNLNNIVKVNKKKSYVTVCQFVS